MKVRWAFVAVLAFVLALPAPISSAAEGDAPSGPEACLTDTINVMRSGGDLAWSGVLQEELRRHAEEMAATGDISHDGMSLRVEDLPVGWTGYGETAYVENLPSVDVDGVETWCDRSVEALWDSDPHRLVLSSGGYEFVSVGAHWDGERIWVATGVFSHPTYQPEPVEWPAYDEGLVEGGQGRFYDDDNSPFENDIEALAAAGITSGCNPPENTRFCPGAAVTRGEMAAFLVRAFGWEVRGDDQFVDDDSSVFEREIEILAATGVTLGCNPPTNDAFCPEAPVTRAAMATFLGRALDLEPSSQDAFTDTTSTVHRRYINALFEAGVTQGCDPAGTRFCPDAVVTRGQMAAFLVRAGLAD